DRNHIFRKSINLYYFCRFIQFDKKCVQDIFSMYANTCLPSYNMAFLPFGNAKLCGIIISDYNRSGLIWDGDNYSCAYDALFTVLYEIWVTDTKVWTKQFKEINQHHLKSLSICFKKYMNGQASFETARDTIRHELHSQSPGQFPCGIRGTSVAALTSAILAPHDAVAISSPKCTNCEYSEPSVDDNSVSFFLAHPLRTSRFTN